MSGAVGLALALLLANDAAAPGSATTPGAPPAGEQPAPSPAPEAPGPPRGRPRRDRSVENELPLAPGAGDRGAPEPWRPLQLRPRDPMVAAVLGGVVGFGSGLHYAGDPVPGVAFGAADAVFAGGLATLEVLLNRDALKRDYEVGKSLGRGERSMTGHEKSLAAGAWIAGGLLVASHVAQAFLGLRAAQRYDAALEQVSCVPLGGDVAPR